MHQNFLVHAPDDDDLAVSRVNIDDVPADEAADPTEDISARTARGRRAVAEVVGHREPVLIRLHRTA